MKYFAERLKSARLMNGLSLQGLADRIDNKVTKQALSKYEKGQVTPDSSMISLLSEALRVRPDFFYSETDVNFGQIEFRKLKRYSAKEKARIIEITRDILRRYIELEEILGIQTQLQNPLKGIAIAQENAKRDVEKAAAALRQAWKLGSDPIANAIELLEDNHIKVIEIDSSVELDGFSTYINDQVPVIVLNKNKLDQNPDRKRWTALHELGHLLLDDLAKLPEKDKESLCHYFAGALLFPEEVIKAELGERRTRLSFHELGALKQQYGISMQAIVYRAKDLDIISDNYYKQFFFMFSQMGYKKKEPYKYQGYEKSNRFSQLLFKALAEELISMSKAAALNNQKLAEFRDENLVI
jgi:Zn-dependent peptidase ImmA (M78 family)/DNA-binding XRE family transcriptional regulator